MKEGSKANVDKVLLSTGTVSVGVVKRSVNVGKNRCNDQVKLQQSSSRILLIKSNSVLRTGEYTVQVNKCPQTQSQLPQAFDWCETSRHAQNQQIRVHLLHLPWYTPLIQEISLIDQCVRRTCYIGYNCKSVLEETTTYMQLKLKRSRSPCRIGSRTIQFCDIDRSISS